MRNYVDTLIVVPNENLFSIINRETPMTEAFEYADDVLDRAIRSSLMEDSSSDLENEKFRFGNINGLTNVTVQVGTIAYMHCPVVNLGERTVSIDNICY